MPSLPGRSCRVHGCAEVASSKNNGYCEKHKNNGWKDFQKSKEGETRPYQLAVWRKKRELVIDRAMGLCEQCEKDGIVTPGRDVDHIKPVSQGGTDDISNLQFLCVSCHKKKTANE